MEKRIARIQVKELSDSGEFQGYGAVFGNIDYYRDIIMPGAFSEFLSSNERSLPLLWQHQSDQVAGIIKEMKENERGLLIKCQLAIKTKLGGDVHELLKMGAVSGLSIGYRVIEETYDHESKITMLNRIELLEISVVTFPANDEARISEVKQILNAGGMPTERECEGLLREVGFSRTQAKTFISQGYKAIQRDAESSDSETLLAESLKGLLTAFNS